jgi:hypothetical protein
MIMFVGKNVRSKESWSVGSGSGRRRKRVRMMRERGGEESGERFR